MTLKKFRTYLNTCSFEEVWAEIVETYNESEAMKPIYSDYYNKLLAVPIKSSKEMICIGSNPLVQPFGMNAAPDYLIDKKVKSHNPNPIKISAILLYWSSLYSFYTSKEHDDDLFEYLNIISTDETGRALADYLMKSIKPNPHRRAIEQSIVKKTELFWEDTISRHNPGDWRSILDMLKRTLEYNMGFMRGYADHEGREHDADRMQLCCNLIDGATADIYPNERSRRMLKLLFTILEQNITRWSD